MTLYEVTRDYLVKWRCEPHAMYGTAAGWPYAAWRRVAEDAGLRAPTDGQVKEVLHRLSSEGQMTLW